MDQAQRCGCERGIRGVSGLLWASALLPLAVLIWAAERCGMDFPWAEDWPFCEKVLAPLYEGRPIWAGLCAPVNGYAKFTTWVIRAPLALFTHWSQAWEIGLNIACGVGILACVLACVREAARAAGRRFPAAFVPLAAFMVLGLDKSCIWFWGDGLTYTLGVLAVAAGLLALSAPQLSWKRLSLAGVMGAIGLFAFASALPYLATATALLAARGLATRRWRALALWVLFCAAATVLYWLNTRASGVIDWRGMDRLARLSLTARFLPVFLGAGLTKFHLRAAGAAGLAGLAIGLWAVWRAWRHRQALGGGAVPFLLFMLFAVLCGIAACATREKDAASLHEMAPQRAAIEGHHKLVQTLEQDGTCALELFDRAIVERANLRVLFMSGCLEDAIGRHGVLEPGIEFIEKPFAVNDLLAKVGAIL